MGGVLARQGNDAHWAIQDEVKSGGEYVPSLGGTRAWATRGRPVRVVAEKGVKNVQAFGWSTVAPEVVAMLKNPEAKFYLVLTDVDGNQVSIEIDPAGVELRADAGTGVKTANYVKIPLVALEVEAPGEPPVELLGAGTATMRVESQPAVKLKAKPRSPPEAKAKRHIEPGHVEWTRADNWRSNAVDVKTYYDPVEMLYTREYWRNGRKLKVDHLTDAGMRSGRDWPIRTFDGESE